MRLGILPVDKAAYSPSFHSSTQSLSILINNSIAKQVGAKLLHLQCYKFFHSYNVQCSTMYVSCIVFAKFK